MNDDHMANDTTGQVRCGLYRTTLDIEGKLEAGTLVYYHNHGDPGPGLYPPEGWQHNKAVFSKTGLLLPSPEWEQTLVPLPAEGFYHVIEPFYCCEQQCRRFERGTLVQLGYNRRADPILFVPIWTFRGLQLPKRGTKIDEARFELIRPLKLVERFDRKDLARRDPGPVFIPPSGTGYIQ